MDYQLKKRKDALILSSGRVLNAAFALPTVISLWYMGSNTMITAWLVLVTLAFLAGLTFRERWLFSGERIAFRFYLFALPLQKRDISPEDVSAVQLKTFIRGENSPVEPGSDRKWYQTEQGLVKLILADGTEETLMIDKNRNTVRLQEKGEVIADFLKVPFLINEDGPA